MITCLAIDDDPLFLQILEAHLSDIEDVQLLATYSNPVDGIMQVVKRKPDILFIDLDMPYLDGFETLETLENSPKIIMISAHVNAPVKEKRLRIDKYLRKVQLSKELLEKSIHQVLTS